jgi:large subunit ribosomal protein L6
MSRIGKQPIPLDSSVKVSVDAGVVSVQGPKGSMSHGLPGGISAKLEENRLVLARSDDTKSQKALHGLARALLANAVTGVTKGFTKNLEIHGVGYRAEVAGNKVKLSLGYTHPIEFAVPEGISVKVERNTMTVSGCDRQQVGQVAADLRAMRPPDVYKLKGIRYSGEQLRKKAGKTAIK